MRSDVALGAGATVGAVAYFLKHLDPGCAVTGIERDPT